MNAEDKQEVLAMMRVFYDSPAVLHTSSDKVLENDFEACISDLPFLDGYLMVDDGNVAGYAMASLNFTTEYGGICVWLEDLYIKPEFRRKGIGSALLSFLETQYPQAVRFKLEAEPENEGAISCYERHGYRVSMYHLLTKELDRDAK
ncbi:MAG: GNAT family N-acetyltransferase [Oscillospiraceae bacterium]|nr:GNAT family N-acetyltransferase [Oscillospiraceae bacterium]